MATKTTTTPQAADAALHCTYCGARFAQQAGWPRACANCGRVTYKNPLPVVVVLMPVYHPSGLLVVRRSVKGDPGHGKLALPGGFIDAADESWQHAAARELREETGLCLPPAWFSVYDVRSAPNGTLLLFTTARGVPSRTLPPFRETSETSEVAVIDAPQDLAFPLHTEVARLWFEQQKQRHRSGDVSAAAH